MADLVLAVDIGGTKMAGGLVGLDGSLVERAGADAGHRAGGGGGRTSALWADLAAWCSG